MGEVGKSHANLERTEWSWKIRAEVQKFKLNLVRLSEVGRFDDELMMNFPTSVTTFQFHSNFSQDFPTATKPSNISETFQLQRNFSTSRGSFQLRLDLSNFSQIFQLQTFQPKTFQLPFPTTRIPFYHWYILHRWHTLLLRPRESIKNFSSSDRLVDFRLFRRTRSHR